MALDHVRMYFGYGTWYSEPTNLATTTPLLFFTRWITHFCAPVFILLSGTSAYLYGIKKGNNKDVSKFLLTRGLWLIFVELIVVNFAWTFDITYSFRILQVIWAIGISMVVLSALVFLPNKFILAMGLILVFAHNLLDPITMSGNRLRSLAWYVLHQPTTIFFGSGKMVNFVYPVLPWIGLMAIGYTLGVLYQQDFDADKRRQWLFRLGISLVVLFFVLRGFNLYGEPKVWSEQSSLTYSIMSFLNTTKYPPSLHFLLMTIGPALIFLSFSERLNNKLTTPIIIFGKVPFFFYIVHVYFIHALAMIFLVLNEHKWDEYILSAQEIRSGALSRFGVSTEAVYIVWIIVIAALYPLCRWYQSYKQSHPENRWLSYL
jgi:uncharacterized membrane protein